MAGEGLDEGVEGDDQRQRVGERMAGGGKRQPRCALAQRREVTNTAAPLAASAVGGLGHRRLRTRRGRRAPAPGSPASTSASGPCMTSAAL